MSSASLLRFLEDFGHPSAGAPSGMPAGASSIVAMPEAADFAVIAEEDPSLEERLASARAEGVREAVEEMSKRHRAELVKLRNELEGAAKKARDDEMAAFATATEALFAQYDAWLDRMFEASLRPLIATAARDTALEALKERILEAAGRRSLPVRLCGPESAVAQMTEMLKSTGLEVDAQPDGGTELRAEIDAQSLQTRFGRIGELLSTGLKTMPEAGDD